ncbi:MULTISPECIES: DcrB-related protein [Pseudomonas syringae group]|uniref:DcrB-related protein n=5 Tax=Pseudomonas syringae group TaxID=136849 RepID=A0AA40P5K2_9PSED|nr:MULTISPECIES: DcrB-related protein [Pseudomonas syringae group]KGS15725.1 hypothetical protein OA77_04270 [Pseudomonas coronafaciens]KOP55863.1 hypothetical protein OX88_11885 [Pseudomonas coronafaciens pv. porri]KOP58663.1 hypothetical protein OX90_14465 [Pseudomonas coronafaciens pv. porri]KPB52452.1 Uncharacterized protein AC511_0760 [Pseudomonas coronafaciens pv. oryzae]KPW39009.1 Uncharacterized protein ALO66_02106 [Pseudomonas coronafaciens pv. atropurpurea]
MARPSLYDRISAKRIADEEAARKAALEAPVVEAVPEPEPEPVTPLQDVPTSFNFSGFTLAFPESMLFREIQATVEYKGETLTLSVKRKDVMQGETLEALFEHSVQAFREHDPELRIIRRRDCTLAGCAAKALDFHFKVGSEEHHARLVGALVPLAGKDVLQWLEISCLIDPTKPDLSLWMADFDSMLSGLAAH